MTKVTSNFIKLLAVQDGHIANLTITAGKLAPDSVTTAKVLDRNITTAKIALLGVTSAEIAAGAITEAKYGAASIPTAAYQLLSVGTAQIADESITEDKVAAGAIISTHIGDDQVTENHYADGSIQTAHMADQAVTTAKLGTGSVTTAKMQAFTPNRLLHSNEAGVVAEFAPGLDGQMLTMSGSSLVWGAAAIPTGLLAPYFGATAPTGWVLCDGSTIGDMSSGADQMSATYQTLFEFLWNNFGNSTIAVVGGRGISAAADWAAHKEITLPDMRGRTPVGVETSETSSGRIDLALITGGASAVCATGGSDMVALTTSLIPEHHHTLMVDGAGSNISGNRSSTNAIYSDGDSGNANNYRACLTSTYITPTIGKSGPAGTGSDPEHNNMQPFMLVNYILKA